MSSAREGSGKVKCVKCGVELKETAKACHKCGTPVSSGVTWQPGWRWHVKTLGIIYALLAVAYVVIRVALK